MYCFVLHIGIYINVVQIAKRHTSPVLAFNMQTRPNILPDMAYARWKQAQDLCVSLLFVKYTYIPICNTKQYIQMYPPELEIKDTTESNTSASYLDLLLSIGRDGQLHTSLYDKRDDFNFHITNFPFLSSNIPSSPAYGVFISQLIRYARACSSYECFILRAMRLSNKLLGQGYVKERLKSSLRKFYGRYGDLTKQYEVPLSRMLHDILDDDHIQWHPPLIGHYTNFWPLLIWTLLPNLTFYLIVQGFHRTYATGAACQQRTLTPPDTWSCPTLGLACVLMSRPISPELVLSPDFWISNTPRYFSFALQDRLPYTSSFWYL